MSLRGKKLLMEYGAMWCVRPLFLDRRAAARYRALASIIPDRERPEETTICYKISLVQLITNLNVILYLSTCHILYELSLKEILFWPVESTELVSHD